MKKIKLTKTTTEILPKTFEEWVEIHGEPEYLYEPSHKIKKKLDIHVTDCEEEHIEVDTEGIFSENKNGNQVINYKKFIDAFIQINQCVYCNGTFYTPEGAVSNQSIRKDIAYSLADMGWVSKLDAPTNSIFTSLKDMCPVDELEVDASVIPLANGDLHIGGSTWEFRLGEKKPTPYRLSVNYTPKTEPTPLFDKWLKDVFAAEDIPVIQEIFGYCLVPTTAAQEAFFLVGDAGVGKSGMGAILRSLMGGAFIPITTQDLLSNRFGMSSVENKLIAYDDDLGTAALEETGTLKKLITADIPIPAERKYADSFTFIPYARIIACANFMLSSLYDDSDGFYRRLHPIVVKDKDPNRKTINKFYDMIVKEEKEQILRWALVGLKRVIKNGWKISWSDRSREYLGNFKAQTNPIEEFFNATIEFGEDYDISFAEMKKTFSTWCKDNGIRDISDRRLSRWLSDNAEKKSIEYDKNIKRGNKYVRGYRGCKIRSEWLDTIPI